MSKKQSRRAYNLTPEAYARIERCADRTGRSKSFVLEAIVAADVTGHPLEELLTATDLPALPPIPSQPTPSADTGYILSEEAYLRVQRCAERTGRSASFVLEAVIASGMTKADLGEILSSGTLPSLPSYEDDPRGSGVCMF